MPITRKFAIVAGAAAIVAGPTTDSEFSGEGG